MVNSKRVKIVKLITVKCTLSFSPSLKGWKKPLFSELMWKFLVLLDIIAQRGDEGRRLLEECLLLTEERKGKEHPSSVMHLLNLATSYSHTKNYVEAERLLRAALEIMMMTVAPDDQSVTFPMLHLAVTLYNLKRDEEAEQLAVDVIRIREKTFGRDSLPVGEGFTISFTWKFPGSFLNAHTFFFLEN